MDEIETPSHVTKFIPKLEDLFECFFSPVGKPISAKVEPAKAEHKK